MAERLLISIITPTFNRATYLREAIESVLAQDYPEFEHIIVDGGSTDDTLQVLKQYSHLRWTSEPDDGMYDAINKGLRMAKGNVIGLLNSDDLYEPNVFGEVVHCFEENPDLEAVVGGAEVFRGPFPERQIVRTNLWIEPQGQWLRLIEGAPVTNAWFFRRQVFERVGNFDVRYRYSADREFLIRAALAGLHYQPIRRILYHYRQHEGSATVHPEDGRSLQRAQTRTRVLQEALMLSEEFLNRHELPPGVRQHLVRFHDHRAYALAATALYHRKIGLAWQAIWAGLRFNLFWPWIFLFFLACRLFGHQNS
jgi:glycosyltransferase involved in cell wall biosynthesis